MGTLKSGHNLGSIKISYPIDAFIETKEENQESASDLLRPYSWWSGGDQPQGSPTDTGANTVGLHFTEPSMCLS